MKVKVLINHQETIVGLKISGQLIGEEGIVSNQIEILSRPGYHNVEEILVEKLKEMIDNSDIYYQLIQ